MVVICVGLKVRYFLIINVITKEASMAINFLCPTHRNWVYFHPQEALSELEQTQQQGELLMKKQDWPEACTFLGCAFETIEILMQLQGGTKSFLLGRLTVLASMLSHAFYQQSEYEYQHQIITQAKHKLQTAAQASLGNKPRLAYIQECISTLKVETPILHSASSASIH